MFKVKVKKLAHYNRGHSLRSYERSGAAEADIIAALSEPLVIKPGERVLIPTGLSMEIPPGFEIQVRPRSGMSFKTSLMVLNAPGTIDSDYRGEVKIIMGNLGSSDEIINPGDRVAQLVLSPVYQATYELSEDDLTETKRGSGGFGSTGKQ